MNCPELETAALKRPYSKRWRETPPASACAQRLECGRFSAAFRASHSSSRLISKALLAILLCIFGSLALPARAQNIVINEIMYHPASQSPRDEWIEFHNLDATNVNVSGWTLGGGVDFVFPDNTIINAGGYLIVAGQKASFQALYPAVANVVGDFAVLRITNVVGYAITNWQNTLSNTRNAIELDDANGNSIDRVEYADEGDWAQRQRGPNDQGRRGWKWYAPHDGLGSSLELINAALPNEYGQNWTYSSAFGGSPGAANPAASANVAPLILDVAHFPTVPRSTNSVSVTARLLNESPSGLTVRLYWRVDVAAPPAFSFTAMFDDGAHGDGLANDGLYAVSIPAQANNAVVEFYVHATDGQGNTRSWPAPALPAADDPGGSPTNAANALFQVDDSAQNDFVASGQPIFKFIFTEAERAELAGIPCVTGTDAEMNATFVSLDGQGTDVRYQNGVRNRGNSSRCANPPNYRINFPSDRLWRDIGGLNLNSVQVYLQHFGSTLAVKSGAVGAYSRAVKVRVNNANLATSGSPMFGSYAANEAYNTDWAENHFPLDGGGNGYRAQRNIDPSEFDYRGENPSSYRNTYFKESNVSEDDWRDLIVMHNVMGLNGVVPFVEGNVRQVVNVEQWFTHLAVMSLMANSESGLNSGHNDDYFMYRGVNDPRFILVFHDLDQLFDRAGQALGTSDTIWGAAYIQGSPTNTYQRSTGDNDGSGHMMYRFMHSPEFEPLYYATLQRLLDTTFSKPQFDALIDQTLGSYVTPNAINAIRTWMDARRSYVQSVINGFVPPKVIPPVATISGEPRNPSPSPNASLTVGGAGISHYMFKLNNGSFGAETPVATAIALSNLPQGSTNIVYVIGKSTNGTWQSASAPTVSKTWVVNTSTPTVRLNEVLASNNGAVLHDGTTPDVLELFNDGAASVDLAGLRLTDDKDAPDKFAFPPGTTLAAGAYLTVYANNVDGTPGLHTGFSLDPDGDQLYLFDRVANGNAVLDSVKFGMQITDLSIGRTGAGSTWVLALPSFGSANGAQALGNDANLRINEWLASGGAQSDFIEIYNPSAQPVALGGLFLTDEPIGAPTLHRVAELSFISANGFAAFTADGDDNEPSHVGFQLPSEVGEIGLFSAILQPIDCVIYGPQQTGVSMGRCPDGGFTNRFLTLPTPAFMNSCPVAPPPPAIITLLAMNEFWRYDASGGDPGVAWRATNYVDSAWPLGRGVLGYDNGNNPLVASLTNTVLPLTTGGGTFINTFYFRTHFNYPSGVTPSSLVFTNLMDDGVIVYLNGEEVYRLNMPQGPVSASTQASQNAESTSFMEVMVPITSNLVPGDNMVAVELHQFSTNPDHNMGLAIGAIIITNSAGQAGILINEALADNASAQEPDGSTPDWIEIYNPSSNTVDLADMSLSDTLANPRRWVFSVGSIIPGLGYRRVRFDSDLPASATNTGWGLNNTGDPLFLFNTLADGGGLRDAITFGLQIPDFSVSRLPDGSGTWNLSLPTIGSANLAATLGDPVSLKVNEWMANPLPGEDDYFEIYNPGAQPIALGGLWLTDDLTVRNKHQIAALSFIGAPTNAWVEFKADGNTASGADHVSFSLRAQGEAVGISLANLTLIDGISFTNQAEGVSIGRLPDGAGLVTSFPNTASPGSANFLLLTNIVINEALTHSDPPFEDAIELRNLAGASTNLGGWWLSDARGEPRKYRIPAGTTLAANGFGVFYENQFNNADTALTPFSLSSAKGDQIFLSAVDGSGALTGYRALVEFDAAENGVSFGRYVNSVGSADFTAMSARTFGVDNPATVENFRTGAGLANPYPKVGPLVFSEVMYHPPDLGTNDNTRDEFLELRNVTGSAVPLYDVDYPTNHWRIRGGVDFDFPAFMSIPSGASLVVVSFDPLANPADAAAFRAAYGLSDNALLYGPWTGKLDNGGEKIELQKPDVPQLPPSSDAGLVPYIVVEAIRYLDTLPWPTNADGAGRSLQRVSNAGYGNDPTNWIGALPNPTPPIAGGGDTDGDGMPDSWEQMHGLIVGVNDAGSDADGDGMTNLQEYLAGTDPQSVASRLTVAISLTPANSARLQFAASSNVSYTLQHRVSVGAGAWLNLQSISSVPSNRTLIITNVPGASTRFYRVTVP